MRVYALYLLVAGLSVYAWKDWFKSLCGLIVLMAVFEHADMPSKVMGIQGLNPWNVLMAAILVAWLASRQRERLQWDMPRTISIVLLLYFVVIVVGWFRMVLEPANMEWYPFKSMISEELINTVKWVIPGLLLYDGCRDRKRLKWALASVLLLGLLLGVQVIRRMPASAALGGADGNIHRIRMRVCRDIGYSAVAMAVFLAGASWAFVSATIAVRTRWQKSILGFVAVLLAYATALTGGRGGYLAWGATGLILCAIRWRRYLVIAPLVPIVLYVVFPGAAERMMVGTAEVDPAGQTNVDEHSLSSGRLAAWPYVIDKIAESPAIGFGRHAMVRTGVAHEVAIQEHGGHLAFAHPHNMYLEWLLDNGVIGMIPVILLFGIGLRQAGGLFLDRRDRLFAAAGGVCLALVVSQLVGGLTGQYFYPKTVTLGMWSLILLTTRLNVESRRAVGQCSSGYALTRVRPVAAVG